MEHHCRRQSWSETLGLSLEEISAATTTEEQAIQETQDTKMNEADEIGEGDSHGGGCLATTPSKFVGEAFGRLNILGTAMNEPL